MDYGVTFGVVSSLDSGYSELLQEAGRGVRMGVKVRCRVLPPFDLPPRDHGTR
jgi:hypothetical protein